MKYSNGYLLETLPELVRVDEIALTMLDTKLLLVLAELLTDALLELNMELLLDEALLELDEEALLEDDAPVFPQPAKNIKLMIVAVIPNVIRVLFFI